MAEAPTCHHPATALVFEPCPPQTCWFHRAPDTPEVRSERASQLLKQEMLLAQLTGARTRLAALYLPQSKPKIVWDCRVNGQHTCMHCLSSGSQPRDAHAGIDHCAMACVMVCRPPAKSNPSGSEEATESSTHPLYLRPDAGIGYDTQGAHVGLWDPVACAGWRSRPPHLLRCCLAGGVNEIVDCALWQSVFGCRPR